MEKEEVTYLVVDGPSAKQLQSAAFCECEKCQTLKFTILSSRDDLKEYWEVKTENTENQVKEIGDGYWQVEGIAFLEVLYRSPGFKPDLGNETYMSISHTYKTEIIYKPAQKTGEVKYLRR